jgi:hypothetical protein
MQVILKKVTEQVLTAAWKGRDVGDESVADWSSATLDAGG